jgi:gamma-glutamyltranspeptidase/glutathione hydrolase
MNVQEATEAPNIESYQLYASFGDHAKVPGGLMIQKETPAWTMRELQKLGYRLTTDDRTSGPINAIYFDWEHGTFWGGSSNHGEDYGIGW